MKKHIILCGIVASFVLGATGCKDNKPIEEYTNKLESISKSISDKEFNSAERDLEELLKADIKDKDVKSKVQAMKDKLTTEKEKVETIAKIDSSKQEEIKNQNSQETPKKQEETNKKSTLLNKKKYIDKLNNIEVGLKDLDKRYSGTTQEMKAAAGEAYNRWDSALNEIYGVLKQGLKPNVMNDLKNEQVKWITYRDNTAKKASEEHKGGTMEGLVYVDTQGNVTKEKCYELVEKYMQ